MSITSATGTSLYALRFATHLSFHQQGLHKQSEPYRRRCGSLLRLLETENNGVQLGESFSFSDATEFGHDVWITRMSVKDSKTPYVNCSASEYCQSLPAIKHVCCAGKHHPLPDVKLVIVVVVTCSVQLALVLPMSWQSAK